jgi:hypothetical protein
MRTTLRGTSAVKDRRQAALDYENGLVHFVQKVHDRAAREPVNLTV